MFTTVDTGYHEGSQRIFNHNYATTLTQSTQSFFYPEPIVVLLRMSEQATTTRRF